MNVKHDKIIALLKKDYPLEDGIYICTQDIPHSKSAGEGILGRLKSFLKSYPALYQNCVELLTPVHVSKAMRDALQVTLQGYGKNDSIVNIGCGPLGLPQRPDIINIDITRFKCVDICANAEDLPFVNDSVDCVISLATLEHVANPLSAALEMIRVLKPGGTILCYIPFCQPEHAAPSDYTRWTLSGIQTLFNCVSLQETGIGAGPTSSWLWISLEWISMALSLGSAKIKDLLFLFLMCILFPIKYIDIMLEKHPSAHRIASAFYIVGIKSFPGTIEHPHAP